MGLHKWSATTGRGFMATSWLLPVPDFGSVATFLAADLPPALSGFLASHEMLRT
jgi:hypothetical protein